MSRDVLILIRQIHYKGHWKGVGPENYFRHLDIWKKKEKRKKERKKERKNK